MPGSVAAVGIVACTAALAFGFAAVGSAAVFGQRLTGAADAAALAAADTASGAVTGVPCDRAETVAAALGVTVSRCDVDGATATVTVGSSFGRVAATASARAGPPPSAGPSPGP